MNLMNQTAMPRPTARAPSTRAAGALDAGRDTPTPDRHEPSVATQCLQKISLIRNFMVA